MDAKRQLAEALDQLEQPQIAMLIYEELMTLNPGDNQGIRYHLLVNYLGLKNYEKAGRLLDQFEDDPGCDWLFGRTYLEFSRTCDEICANGWKPKTTFDSESVDLFEGIDPKILKPARDALKKAVLRYPWSLLFLTDDRILSFDFSSMYLVGSPEESMAHASRSYALWMTHIFVSTWLAMEGVEVVKENPDAKRKLREHSAKFNVYLSLLSEVKRPASRTPESELRIGIPAMIQEELIDLSGIRGKWKNSSAGAA